jgi:trehalose 6-phosphate synthase/phosphatase
MMTQRLLIVSNRLPITAHVRQEEFSFTPSVGGLATGLREAGDGMDTLWVGWPGDLPRLDARRQRLLDDELAAQGLAAVHLSRREVQGFYESVANGVLWPVFHGNFEQLPLDFRAWDDFVSVNEKYAQVVADRYRPGDLIWIHDYHLLLLPRMLRERIPDASIGFFLHIPFPPWEIFSILPWRDEILRGLLGADLVGVHTPGYLRHFANAMERLLGADVDIDRVRHGGRQVHLGSFPMGVDAASWNARSGEASVLEQAAMLRGDAGGRAILLGVDRLDYTKGILRRCLAVERLLREDEGIRDRLRFIQVTVPSRQRVEAYSGLRRRVDELVGRINAAHSSASAVPIHRIHQTLSQEELSVLYRATDVLLVTPLRDGMNLVAKEFVASRPDEDGVLVLSEFAGAASEMGEAVHVNPYDLDGTAHAIRRALDMPREERRQRMRALRGRVFDQDIHRWVTSFIEQLARASRQSRASSATVMAGLAQLRRVVSGLRREQDIVLIMDYDGTLVPFADSPDAAAPDQDLLGLLSALAADPRVHVHIVSGRTRESIARWFDALPIGLSAEHGLWSRPAGVPTWSMTRQIKVDWKERIRPLFEQFTAATRGTFIEEKTAALTWHYRTATADYTNGANFGEVQARELRLLLSDLLSNSPVEVLPGHKVVEVRPHGMNKGMIVPPILAAAAPHSAIIAIGDDRTDEDLFEALPDGTLTVHVGEGESMALYRLRDSTEVRQLLRELIQNTTVAAGAAQRR